MLEKNEKLKKYIRIYTTPSSVYQLCEKQKHLKDGYVMVKTKKEYPFIYEVGYKFIDVSLVSKTSDKLEELIDAVVVERMGMPMSFNMPPKATYEFVHDYLEARKNERYRVYGAIWTDKGLIYVAKFTIEDGGKLELI